jgi:hypothetical protein
VRTLRLALAAVALGAAFAVPASASEPPVGICSQDIDWGNVNDVLAQLPEPVARAVVSTICRV